MDIQVDNEKYGLALAILSGMIGVCFADLHAEQSKMNPDKMVVERLKERFQGYFDERELLGSRDDAALQAIIEKVGPLVRAAVGTTGEARGTA